MSIFQIAATLFALLMLYVVQIHFKKKTLTIVESFFWSSLWVLFIVIAVFPDLLKGISDSLNFTRVFDLLLVIGLMILSVVSFKSYFDQKQTRLRIEQLVRDLSFKAAEKKA